MKDNNKRILNYAAPVRKKQQNHQKSNAKILLPKKSEN